jgi:UDP-N-acetyl-D-mannosaminuronate dehydrogenase
VIYEIVNLICRPASKEELMKMKITLILALGFLGVVQADETLNEKAEVKGNDMNRAAKKGTNRMKEMICAEGDAKCLAKKAKHRVDESSDAIGDKTKEVIHKAN